MPGHHPPSLSCCLTLTSLRWESVTQTCTTLLASDNFWGASLQRVSTFLIFFANRNAVSLLNMCGRQFNRKLFLTSFLFLWRFERLQLPYVFSHLCGCCTVTHVELLFLLTLLYSLRLMQFLTVKALQKLVWNTVFFSSSFLREFWVPIAQLLYVRKCGPWWWNQEWRSFELEQLELLK